MSEDAIREAAEEFVQARWRAYQMGHEDVEAALLTGVPKSTVRAQIRGEDGKNSQSETDAMMEGTYSRYGSGSFMRNAVGEAEDAERKAELERRQRLALQYIKAAEDRILSSEQP